MLPTLRRSPIETDTTLVVGSETALLHRVLNVLSLRSRGQMGRIDTARVIAGVHHDAPCRDRLSVGEFPRDAMRVIELPRHGVAHNLAVAVTANRAALKLPAAGTLDRPRGQTLGQRIAPIASAPQPRSGSPPR